MTEKNKGGRPKKQIDIEMFEKMCEIQCTKDEICSILNIDEKTLTRWCKETYNMGFSEIYKKRSKKGLMSLRRIQFKLAEKNVTMAIWLGKQYLGQKDKIETEENQETLNKLDEMLKTVKESINNGI